MRWAKRIRQEIEAWQKSWRILFPEKPKPALEQPSNVVIMKKVEPYQVKATAERLLLENGAAPTHKQIADELNVSRSTVTRHLAKTG